MEFGNLCLRLCALSCLLHCVRPNEASTPTPATTIGKDPPEVTKTSTITVANAETTPKATTPPPTTPKSTEATTRLTTTKPPTLAPTSKAVTTLKPSTPTTSEKTAVITTISKSEANPTTMVPKTGDVTPISGPIPGLTTQPTPTTMGPTEGTKTSTKNPETVPGTTIGATIPAATTEDNAKRPEISIIATTNQAGTTVMVTSKTSVDQIPPKSTPRPQDPPTSMTPPPGVTEGGATGVTGGVTTVGGATEGVTTVGGTSVATGGGAKGVTIATTARTTVPDTTVLPDTTTTPTTEPPQTRIYSYSLNKGDQSGEEKDLMLLCQLLMGSLEDGNCTVAYRHQNGKVHCEGVQITGKVKATIVTQHYEDITKKPTDNKTLITILSSCGALLLMIIILAVCASHVRKPFHGNQSRQQYLTEELQTVENGYHDNPTLEVMEAEPEMQEKKVLNGEFNDSWIVPIDNLLKEELPEEEDTHL